MNRSNPGARRAVGDALATMTGQILSFGASLAFSILVPRVLGAENYGEWMLFRGLAIFWLSLLLMGDREVISIFYVPQMAEGKATEAALIFKSLAVFRMAVLPLGLAAALFMLYSSTSVFRTVEGAVCLCATLVLKTLQGNLATLIFGHRRLGWIAFLDVAQAVVMPVFILWSFGDGRTEWLPRAALAADALLFTLAAVLSRFWREWERGWLPRGRMMEIVRYTAMVALASCVIVSLNNLLLYMMNIRGYSSAVMGWVGLSTRSAWIVHSGLITVAMGLMPALAAVQVRQGAGRMYIWQEFLSRLGLTLLMGLIGNFFLLGPVWAGRIWGADFIPITPLLAASLLAIVPTWLSSQWVRLFLLQRSTGIYIRAALLYAVVLCGVFFLLPVDSRGWTPIIALLAASWMTAVFAAFYVMNKGVSIRWLIRFLPAAAWMAVAACRGSADDSGLTSVGLAALWSLGYVAAILLPGAVRIFELRSVWSALWTSKMK